MPGQSRRLLIRGTGFTLVEVLVALAIVATSLAALGRAMLSGLEFERELKARTCAQWVADDRHALARATHAWRAPGTGTGQIEQAGMVFIWRELVTATPNVAFQRLEVTVARAEEPDRVLARRIGFMYRHAWS